MRIVVAGGTGLIGRRLLTALLSGSNRVGVLTRSRHPDLPENVDVLHWPEGLFDPSRYSDAKTNHTQLVEQLRGADVIVNFAGESIAARRWTRRQKEILRSSRINATRAIVDALRHLDSPPSVLINASAVGFYGPKDDAIVTEEEPPGNDFLSHVCVSWEREAKEAESLGIRVVRLRTGLVLARDGGALPRLVLPFRFFVGGPLGSGRQWTPWIHIDDIVRLVTFSLEKDDLHGAVNAVAPNPMTNREFCRVLGRVLKRPSRLPAPAFALRLALGEMADALLLSGQRAIPKRALDHGFIFRYEQLEDALRQLFHSHGSA